MYDKIGVADRLELVLYAVHEGLERLSNYHPDGKQHLMPAIAR